MVVMRMIASVLRPPRSSKQVFSLEHTRAVVESILGSGMHLARVRSIANGVAGVLNASKISIAAVGRAYAGLAGVQRKSGVKQVDRLLSNQGVKLEQVLPRWVQFVAGDVSELLIAVDWTDFAHDDHTTLYAALIPRGGRGGRATPLLWQTVRKSELKRQRTQLELAFVERLHASIPDGVRVEIVADRGFGYQQLYALLSSLGWDYTIRFRENVLLVEGPGPALAAAAYVPANGRARKITGVGVTRRGFPVPAIVLVRRKNMKEAWCLATTRTDDDARAVLDTYSRRFTIEETFRDTKDPTFGMGLSATHIRDPEKRDRLLLLLAMAHTLLTLLGVASEESGLDRTLKTNTSKRRTLSLFNQGILWYEALGAPATRAEQLAQLLTAYEAVLRRHSALAQLLAFDEVVP